MSRIGKKPIQIPKGVSVEVAKNEITVKGPKGVLSLNLHPDLRVLLTDDILSVSIERSTKRSSALWGLYRNLIFNAVQGVSAGFEKKLEFEGIGYKASVEGDTLLMQLGFSHPVVVKAPEGIRISVEKNVITVAGINKELVGNVAAGIKRLKPPEPYKGKGIRYKGEVIKRKAGKKAVAAG